MLVAMVEPLPTLDEVRAVMKSPKPPVSCRVVEVENGDVRRSAKVLFDGLRTWFIDDGERVEMRGSDDSALFDSGGKLERVGPGGSYVHSNSWAKLAIEPWRMDLDGAPGRVLRRDELDERLTFVVEFRGLKRPDDNFTFEMQVEKETGIVLSMSRSDTGLVLRLEDLRLGEVVST